MNNLSVEEATQPPCQSPRCPEVAERGQNHTCPSGKKHICPSTSPFPPNCCYQTKWLSVCEFIRDPLYANMINSTSDRELATDWCVFVCVCFPHSDTEFEILHKTGRGQTKRKLNGYRYDKCTDNTHTQNGLV